MKKIFCLALVFLLSISLVRADTVDDLARLARYFPAEAPLYISLYISDESIAKWDTALERYFNSLRSIDYEASPVRDYLDFLASDIVEGGTFDTVYRPWLGDTLAFGALTPETLAYGSRSSTGESSILFVAEITDHDAAEEHMDMVISTGRGLFEQFKGYVKTVEDDYILYHPNESQRSGITFLLLEEAIFIRYSSVEPESIVPDYEETLADVESFEPALRRLPLERYEIALYFDPSALAPYAEDYDAQIRINTILPENVSTSETLEALGPQTLGFAFANDFSLVLDVATHVDEPEALADAGIEIVTSPPVNLALSRALPQNITGFIQDTGLGLGFLQLMTMFKERGSLYEDAASQYYDDFLGQYYDDLALTMLYSFYGLREVLPEAMQADHIVYSTGGLPFGIDPSYNGLLLQVSSPFEQQLALDLLPDILLEQDILAEFDGQSLVINQFAEEAENDEMQIQIRLIESYLQIAPANAQLEFGSRLDETDAYLRAENLFVPDAQIIGYALGTINSFIVYESVSFSTSYDERGTGYIRLVMQIGLD